MKTIIIGVRLYGPLAQYGGKENRKSYAVLNLELQAGMRMRGLLNHLSLPTCERGITFINGILSAMPGLQPDLDHLLKDGDRVAIFHLKSMWPFQYRDGAALTPGLAEAIQNGKEPFR